MSTAQSTGSTTTHRFNQKDGSVLYVSEHRDFDGNQSVLLEHHSGTDLRSAVRLTADQAVDLRDALDAWGL